MTGSGTTVERVKLSIPNRRGQRLAALLERPAGAVRAHAIFAHCFTCSKDIAAASRVSRALAACGIATVRFDFTGLGNSEGDFANTNFSSNVQDLVSVADHLRDEHAAPTLLVGHSLGGAAVLAAAGDVPEVRAVATIGAPSSPDHVAHLFRPQREEIETTGKATVVLAGRTFEIQKQFLDDVEGHRLAERIGALRRALLVFHSPVDEIVGIDNAAEIYAAAKHPKSFISLDRADHLLSRPADSEYVALTLSAWASRYALEAADSTEETTGAGSRSNVADTALEAMSPGSERPALAAGEVLVREVDGKFGQEVFTDRHRLLADEPRSYGGAETGPSPYEYLLAALGTCTSMTLRMYAEHKKLPLERISVKLKHGKIHARDCADCETREGKIDRVKRELVIEGDLTPDQRERLVQIADKCPVHRTLHGEIDVQTRLAE